MNQSISIAALLVSICLPSSVTGIAAEDIVVPKTGKVAPEKAPPVTLAANVSKALPQYLRTIEIQLRIGDEFEIYSHHDHAHLPIFKLERLDAQFRWIKIRLAV